MGAYKWKDLTIQTMDMDSPSANNPYSASKPTRPMANLNVNLHLTSIIRKKIFKTKYIWK